MAEGFRSEVEELQEELERVRRKRQEVGHNPGGRERPEGSAPRAVPEAPPTGQPRTE